MNLNSTLEKPDHSNSDLVRTYIWFSRTITMLHLKSLSLSCVIAWLLGSSGAEAGAAVTRETSPVSNKLFNSLEELSRLVDISYCVGTTGVKKPFQCLSHCAEFPNLELIEVRVTGRLRNPM